MANLVRRYKRGVHKIFDDSYDQRLTGSRILNSGEMNLSILTLFWTKSNIKYELLKLTGSEKGLYMDQGDTMQAIIPLLEQKLTNIQINFENMNIEREMRGQAPYEELPANLLKEKLQIEASIDVHLSEKALLEAKLKGWEMQAEQVRETHVLEYGLRCQVQLHDGKITTIDNQRVEYIEGVPIITDKSSRYYGMSVADFRKLSEQWLTDRRNADAEKLRKMQESDKVNGLPIRKSLPLRTRKTVDVNGLPLFPKEFKNYLVDEKVEK